MIRCFYCGRFLSYTELYSGVVRYTPYGNAFDLDPPDERVIHGSCWDKEHNNLERGVTAWIGPTDYRKKND